MRSVWKIIDIVTGSVLTAKTDSGEDYAPLFSNADGAWEWLKPMGLSPFRFRLSTSGFMIGTGQPLDTEHEPN